MVTEQKDEGLKQITVLLLATAPLDKAAVALGQVQPELQAEFVSRLATVGDNPAKMNWLTTLYQINPLTLIGEEVQPTESAPETSPHYEYNGQGKAGQILMTMPADIAQGIFQRLIAVDRELATTLAANVFFFNEIGDLPDRWVQVLLRELVGKRLGTPDLALAMEDASEGLREKIFRNLSSHQTANLRQELSYLRQPVNDGQRQDAKRDIARVVVKMAQSGEIRILREWISPVIRKDSWDRIDVSTRESLAKIMDALREWSEDQLHGLPVVTQGTVLARALLAARPEIQERMIASLTVRGGQILRDGMEMEMEKGFYLSELAVAVQQVIALGDSDRNYD